MSNTQKYGRGQVIDIINSVINKIDHEKVDSQREVFLHIAELAEIIDSLKKDINSVKPEHVKTTHIPDATDELGAVVTATAEATNRIMSVCEEIQEIAGTLDEGPQNALNDKAMQIFEACSFQDITGQRIKNVVTTLRVIEEKIDAIMNSLGHRVGVKTGDERIEKVISVDDEKSLLNGPQMPDKAITQADIDKLLAEFD
ncbi:MAG: chemotaxis protein [Micavibrio aeruginosavorus]|uniref:Chemotaxis protein n=1 Tax=Micavibrio aeruginosavorus TaxID=349221 RepID=A0A2W5N817_9BACT|nr:MAG: chemotaxis protein [Micavibrio aeruginosavorus]